jgi:ankyrin repeat protein
MQSHSGNNISQNAILKKFVRFLELKKNQADYDPKIVDDLINKLGEGYCSGLASVAAYSLWLEQQPKRIDEVTGKPIPRDDYSWLEKTLNASAEWDGQSLPREEIANNIERLLSLIEYFQNIYSYLPIGHGDLDKSMELTSRNSPNAFQKPNKEYSLAGLLTVEDLEKIILQILPEDRMILISSHNHDISLFKHDDMIMLYDANNPNGRQIYLDSSIQKLSTDIFTAMEYQQKIPSPFAFRTFSFDDKQTFNYPLQNELLKGLPLISGVDNYANNVTALCMAASIGCIESLKIYLTQQADLNQTSKGGATPAYMAAQNGHAQALQVLAENGADLNQTSKGGATPAHIAAQQGHAQVLRVLAENGADLNKADTDGFTPAHTAAQNGHAQALRVLAENGADLNKADTDGFTPAHLAAQNGHAQALRVLAENGADLNQANKNGFTPAYMAAQNGQVETLRVLAEHGVDLNQVNADGDTPAHIAAQQGHAQALQVLAEHGADLNKAALDGNTPAHMAALDGHAEALRVLAEHGANLNKADTDGFTPADIAKDYGHAEALAVILNPPKAHPNQHLLKEKKSQYPNLFSTPLTPPVATPANEPSNKNKAEETPSSSIASKPGSGGGTV